MTKQDWAEISNIAGPILGYIIARIFWSRWWEKRR